MQITIQVLSQEERNQVHERSLKVLETTGVRVDSAAGRRILAEAGARVNDNLHLVHFPRSLVDECLRLTARNFSLGARRHGWNLPMNAGECTLLADGEAIQVLDRHSGRHRPVTPQDWHEATRLIDALDEIGVYWSMVQGGGSSSSMARRVRYWRNIFSNFSKHVQDSLYDAESAPWLLEVLQVIFGDRQRVRELHPWSYLLCPQSPLIIEEKGTDGYLALQGWDVPVAIMPMPLMGGTAPGKMIATAIQGNSEVLAALCLVQAAAPGTPVIYAPVLAAMNPRTGLYSGGAIENGLLGVAVSEMARYYGLPVEASGGGTDQFIPGIQAAYERSLNALLPALSWPDILVGPGLLGSSTILSLEQLLIDVEIFRMSTHAHRGIESGEENWLEEVICRVGPGGHYLGERSTVDGIRSGEWYISELGKHDAQRAALSDGSPLLAETRLLVDEILSEHQPLPLSAEAQSELCKIEARAAELVDGVPGSQVA
jgi:trimethylamine---corrinoid protein Co-methyltransferase